MSGEVLVNLQEEDKVEARDDDNLNNRGQSVGDYLDN